MATSGTSIETNQILSELLASNKRVEALLVIIAENAGQNLPPGWRRRMGDDANQAVSMALSGSTAAEVAEHVHARRGGGLA